VIKPDRDRNYYATTDIVNIGRRSWSWKVVLRQPWPALNLELDTDGGYCLTETGARRKAARAVRRMLRAADSWISTESDADGNVRAEP
jgi:hypothetical protein